MNSEILQEQQNQVETLKKENCEMQLRCTKLETDQHRLKNKLSKIENELLESTAIIHGVHEDRWEEGLHLIQHGSRCPSLYHVWV